MVRFCIGLAIATVGQAVQNTLQPPFPTGSCEVRRFSMVPKSISCRSTLKPARVSRSAVTRPSGAITRLSAAFSTTTVSPA